jgi:hypothetical protein
MPLLYFHSRIIPAATFFFLWILFQPASSHIASIYICASHTMLVYHAWLDYKVERVYISIKIIEIRSMAQMSIVYHDDEENATILYS